MDSIPLESAVRLASRIVIVAHLDAASLGRVRFAPSPVFEALSWLRLTAAGQRHPVFGDPGASARFALRDPDVALVTDVVPASGRFTPDFLTPKAPAGRSSRIFENQLDSIRETPDGEIARELDDEPFGGGRLPAPARRAVESGTFARRAANGLLRFWKQSVSERWGPISSALAADVSRRSETMSAHGVGAALRSLHPGMHWDGKVLRIEGRCEVCSRFADAELVLTPTAFAWPTMYLQLCRTDDASVFYPADGIGTAVGAARTYAMPKLMGATRARLLRDLGQPRSTAELSTRHRLAPATVSYHLGVLLDAGLVVRARHRRVVLYRCSEQAQALLGEPATAS